jgi:hypothetical protein
MALDWKLLLLGAVPPLLAIVAEFFNPVSGQAAASDVKDQIRALIPNRARDADGKVALEQGERVADQERDLAEKIVARSVDNAVEVAGIVPAWISITAGIAGIMSEIVRLEVAAAATALVAMFSAVALFFVLTHINYWRLAEGTRCPILRAGTKRECLSHAIVAANLAVVLAAVVAATLHGAPPQTGPAQPPTAG